MNLAHSARSRRARNSGIWRERAHIDPDAARRYVADYLHTRAGRRYPGLDYEVSTTDDTVVVRVRTPLDLPFRLPGVGTDVPITGTAASVVMVSD